MKNTSFLIIDLLQSLNRKELERFGRFIESTYFNTDRRVVQLFVALKKKVLHKKPFDDQLQAKIYQSIFSDIDVVSTLLNKEQKKVLRVKMSLLTKLAQRFLITEAVADNPACETELLNEKLLEKKQFNLFDRLTKKKQKELEKQSIKGVKSYALAFQLELGRMNYLHHKSLLAKEDNFSVLMHSLDSFYLLLKLDIYSAMLSKMEVISKTYDLSLTQAIQPLLTLPQYAKKPLIRLYSTANLLIETKEETTFIELLELLRQSTTTNKSNLFHFYIVACNFCAHQIRKGQITYTERLLNIYKIMADEKLFIQEGFLLVIMLHNVVISACQFGDYDWAIELVNKYYLFAKKEAQQSVYHCNHGIIEFYKKDYKKTISHMVRVDKINLPYELTSRTLILKAYYEMDIEYDPRTVQIFRSTERFINTHTILPTHQKKSYKNFIRLLINLYRVRHGEGKKTVMGIRQELQKMDFIGNKKWLMEKIEEL